MILGRVIERKIIRLKRGDYRIIFYISEGMVKNGHFSFQTQLPKLKSNSLQEKNDLCLCNLFDHFPTFFLEFGFLDSHLDLVEFFKCMT